MSRPSTPSLESTRRRAQRNWVERMHARRVTVIMRQAAACVALVTVSACAPETRIISARGGLYGLPGAQSSLEIEGEESRAQEPSAAGANPWDRVLAAFPGAEASPTDEEAQAEPGAPDEREPQPQSRAEMLGLRRTARDGSIVLSSRSPSDVMYHVMTTLANEEDDLLFDQVIAEEAKQEYRKRARDPREAVEFLKKRRKDVAELFAAFPMGDQTPGVHLTTIGRNAFRLRAPAALAPDLRLHSMDVVIERGQFRLLGIR